MIISHKYRFIFIKTLKTAGTSIEVFLSPLCGENDVLTPIYPHVEPHMARNYKGIWNPFPEIIQNKGRGTRKIITRLKNRNKYFNHIDAQSVKNRISSRIWNNYFKFCVERNPWDKTLSHYHMINKRAGGNINFEDYLKKGDFCINYHLYTDQQGNQLVDKVIKYESLIDELAQIFSELGIPFKGSHRHFVKELKFFKTLLNFFLLIGFGGQWRGCVRRRTADFIRPVPPYYCQKSMTEYPNSPNI